MVLSSGGHRMKKNLLVVAVMALFSSAVFAANDASSGALSFGFSFPQIYNMNTADSNIDSEKYSAFGINFALRGTFNLPFGLYADGNLYFPYAHKITIDDIEYNYNMKDGSLWGIEGQFGLYSVLFNTGRLLVPFGGGLHLNYGKTSVDGNPDVTQSNFSLGIGGWANLELQLTEKVTLYGGIRLDYDFWQRLKTKTKLNNTASKESTTTGMVSNLFLIPVFGAVVRF